MLNFGRILCGFAFVCAVDAVGQTPLQVIDFSFEGSLGSTGATIEKAGENHFVVSLGHAPEHPDWANMVQFTITGNAKGNPLRLDVVFEHPQPRYDFNDYFYSYSYDGETWQPIHWHQYEGQGNLSDTLLFPSFEEDTVYVGHQVPMSYETFQVLMEDWSESPYVTVHEIGHSLEGRSMYRLAVTDAGAEAPWVHYFGNQHPGEHNSQWRMAGMVNWLLSEAGKPYLKRSINHFVFFTSPDAPSHGWYRVNQEGVDMNRSYRASGADAEEQAHEAFVVQRDLEQIMASDNPITDYWSMHTWQGMVEPIMIPGPEFGGELGSWTKLRDTIINNDPKLYIEPLRTEAPDGGETGHWHQGVHAQFGITTVLCEGAGTIYTKEENMDSGRVLMKSIAAIYR